MSSTTNLYNITFVDIKFYKIGVASN